MIAGCFRRYSVCVRKTPEREKMTHVKRPSMSRLDVQPFSQVIGQWEPLFGAPGLEKEFFIVGDEEGSTFNVQPCPGCERGNLRNRWMRRASVGLSRGWESAGKSQRGKHRRYHVKCWFGSRKFFEPSLHVLLADAELSNIVLYTRDRPQTTFESPVAATPPLPILSLFSLIATHHWPVSCITAFVVGDNYREA